MAEIMYTMDVVSNQQYPSGVKVIKWVLPDAGDTGAPYYCPQYSGKAVQMTAGGASTVPIEGTLVPEGTAPVYNALHDPAGGSLATFTTATGIRQILEDCYAVRLGAAVTTGVTVYLFITTTARR